jgi:hypothetical protein
MGLTRAQNRAKPSAGQAKAGVLSFYSYNERYEGTTTADLTAIAACTSNKQCITDGTPQSRGERRSEQQSLIVENQRESRESPMLNAF